MDELLTSVSPELVDEYADDFFANRGRKTLHDSRRWRVLDTWIGDPAEHFRQDIYHAVLFLLDLCSGLANTLIVGQQQSPLCCLRQASSLAYSGTMTHL